MRLSACYCGKFECITCLWEFLKGSLFEAIFVQRIRNEYVFFLVYPEWISVLNRQITRFAVWPIRRLLTVKSLQNVIHEKNYFFYIYQVLEMNFKKRTLRQNPANPTDISPCSLVVAHSLCKRKVLGSNSTVSKNFTFCNSCSTRDSHRSCKPIKWNQPWHKPS